MAKLYEITDNNDYKIDTSEFGFIILWKENNDISSLVEHHYKDQILAKNGPIVITTGFYILNAQAPETDGPPGALAIGNALIKLGYDIHYVADHQTVTLLHDICPQGSNIIEFPITSHENSIVFCKTLISSVLGFSGLSELADRSVSSS